MPYHRSARQLGLDRRSQWYSMDFHFCPANDARFLLARIPSRIAQTLVQIVTPDPMRGRVAAVSGLFIGASNELDEFESGGMARLVGPFGSALFGDCGPIS